MAGVSIATLTGNNGILTQANQAKENNNSAAVKEKVEVEALGSIDKSGKFNKETFKDNLKTNLKLSDNDIVDNADGTITVKIDGYDVTVNGTTGEVTGVTKSNGEKPTTGVQPGTEVSKTEKDNYTDSNKEKATIPEGFTVDKTENTISSGLVVRGPDGSEFVWVPVSKINNMAQCSTAGGSCNLQLDGDSLKCTTHNSTDIVGKLYATSTGENFGTANTTYNADSGLREPAIVKEYDNNSSYNTIGLKLSDMQRDYRNMAAKVAKYGGFYVGRYETSLSDATESSAGTNGKVQSKQGVIPTSAGNSNYSNDSINNIRDLGSNLREWTLEAYGTIYRVYRGGNYDNTSSPSSRYGSYPSYTYSNNGSRVTLYIK